MDQEPEERLACLVADTLFCSGEFDDVEAELDITRSPAASRVDVRWQGRAYRLVVEAAS